MEVWYGRWMTASTLPNTLDASHIEMEGRVGSAGDKGMQWIS